MKTRARLSLLSLFSVLAAMLLVSCAPPAVRTADLNCSNTPDCRIEVSVNCFMTIFCGAAVDHDRVISRRNGKIDWDIVTAGYTFGANGIVFPTGTAVFQCHVEANGRRYSCANRGDRGEYKYTINLSGSPSVGPLDPWVVNN